MKTARKPNPKNFYACLVQFTWGKDLRFYSTHGIADARDKAGRLAGAVRVLEATQVTEEQFNQFKKQLA